MLPLLDTVRLPVMPAPCRKDVVDCTLNVLAALLPITMFPLAVVRPYTVTALLNVAVDVTDMEFDEELPKAALPVAERAPWKSAVPVAETLARLALTVDVSDPVDSDADVSAPPAMKRKRMASWCAAS